MKVAYITAGAAGMYCGTCIHDNMVATVLKKQGHNVTLIPTYTPTRTDEANVSMDRVFFGGINVYLQQKLPIFRHTPWAIDKLFDNRALLKRTLTVQRLNRCKRPWRTHGFYAPSRTRLSEERTNEISQMAR